MYGYCLIEVPLTHMNIHWHIQISGLHTWCKLLDPLACQYNNADTHSHTRLSGNNLLHPCWLPKHWVAVATGQHAVQPVCLSCRRFVHVCFSEWSRRNKKMGDEDKSSLLKIIYVCGIWAGMFDCVSVSVCMLVFPANWWSVMFGSFNRGVTVPKVDWLKSPSPSLQEWFVIIYTHLYHSFNCLSTQSIMNSIAVWMKMLIIWVEYSPISISHALGLWFVLIAEVICVFPSAQIHHVIYLLKKGFPWINNWV